MATKAPQGLYAHHPPIACPEYVSRAQIKVLPLSSSSALLVFQVSPILCCCYRRDDEHFESLLRSLCRLMSSYHIPKFLSFFFLISVCFFINAHRFFLFSSFWLRREYLSLVALHDVRNRSQALTLSKGQVLMSTHANTESVRNFIRIYTNNVSRFGDAKLSVISVLVIFLCMQCSFFDFPKGLTRMCLPTTLDKPTL